MKVFFFLTLITFYSASSIQEAACDTVADLNDLQVRTFSAAISDIRDGIDHIITILGNSESLRELRQILDEGVFIADNIVDDLVDAVYCNGDANVKEDANKAINKLNDHVVHQFGVFEQRAVKNANPDQKSQIHDYVQGMIQQCFKDLEPLLKLMNQLAQ